MDLFAIVMRRVAQETGAFATTDFLALEPVAKVIL